MPEKPGKNREQLKEITDRIEAGIRDIFESGDMEKYRNYLRTMSRFHNYSLNNQALIHLQRPDATLVAGYNRWRDKFSRHVLRGEKGITIIAPTPYKKKIEQEKLDPDTKLPILDADGKIVTEEKEIEIPMFRPVKVFDYAQTDGKPLPERVASPVANLTGSVENYAAFMEALRRSSPVPVEFKPLSADMDGYFSPKSQSITLREGMSEVQTVSAAVHEIAHAKLHNYGLQQAAERKAKSRNAEEVEAESISFMVCAYFGIETGANSFGYVATWSKNAELPEFRASLDTISKTANGIITDVEKHFAEVCKERGIELPKDTEYELVTIPPSRADALTFAADYAAFLRRDLNVPDSADRPTAETVADRLLAGEDAELRKELEDFVKLADEIGIDDGSHGLLERFNGLFRQEWRAKEEPQPEIETETPNVEDELPPPAGAGARLSHAGYSRRLSGNVSVRLHGRQYHAAADKGARHGAVLAGRSRVPALCRQHRGHGAGRRGYFLPHRRVRRGARGMGRGARRCDVARTGGHGEAVSGKPTGRFPHLSDPARR